jgi:hypothetical protein
MERTGKNKQFILSMRKRIEGISTGRPTSFSRYVEKVFTIPRLPVCIVADGLYPNETVFKICEGNRWKYLFVLQDKSLKTG